MNFATAFNRTRISRALVSVLVLTFIQTIGGPILAPNIVAPKAKAVTGTIAPSTHASGSSITIPYGVSSVTIEAVGGSGGKGGSDGNLGTDGTAAGRVIATFVVSPGDVIGLYGGNFGADGASSAAGNGGGAGGADTFPSNVYSINGTYFTGMNFAGGNGGNAGSGGSSGAGGGAGAASIATINHEIVVIAAGAGGGGGSGSGNNYAANWNGTLTYNGTSFFGSAGTSVGVCTGSYLDSDGGGGGGGGGGYYAGAGGLAPKVVAECAGVAGSPGGNYKKTGGASVTDDRVSVSKGTQGYVKYTYDVAATTTCVQSSSIVDIYTVLTISQVGNCTWTVPSTVSVIDFFMVGGGGGGGGDGGSGGGGGAAQSRTAVTVTPNSNLTLTVGNGGVGGTWGGFATVAGSASSIVTASGTTFTANGGAAGTDGPGSGSGAGGSASNGGFAGGAGGSSPSCYNVGGAGKKGISNYYSGTLQEYGGGGGGGACPNGAATTPASGATGGGGAGGYAVSASLNAPGTNGTDGRGGGGGGGLATGSGLKVDGGKGGSGVILIRYSTVSANEFPASVASALVKRFVPGDLQTLDSSRKGWIDSSGQNAAVAHGNFTGTPTVVNQGTTDSGYTVGSSKTLLTAAGTTSDRVVLSDLPNNYTLFHVARYQRGGTAARIIAGTSSNWLSGFWSGEQAVAFHNTRLFMTPEVATNYTWQLSADKLNTYRSNGKDTTLNVDAFDAPSTATGFGINVGWSGVEYSTWQVADLLVFNRELTNGETRLVELYLSRIYGLTLDSEYVSSDTDTSISLTGSQYLYSQKSVSNYLNDTFTVESWVNPSSNCAVAGGYSCGIFSRENVLLTRIYQGRLWYALYGTGVAWEWYDTTVQVPSNEWHHVTITKRLAGGAADSLDVYLDGQLVWTKVGSPYRTGAASGSASEVVYQENNAWTYIGIRGAYDTDRYYGKIDEVKVWKVARTASQIALDMHSNDASNPLLQIYYDFNKSTLSSSNTVINLAYGGPNRADLVAATTITYADVKTVSSSGPYTTVTFPRTYITQSGGWKVPNGVAKASALVVAGGGGGGSRHGGGGGGGGVSYAPTYLLNSGATYEIKIGTGGFGYGQPGNSPYVDANNLPVTSAGNNANGSGTSGGNSTFKPSNVLESITAIGGGGGGGIGLPGGSSGGSNSGVTKTTVPEKTQYSTSYFVGYGNKGGQGYDGSSCGTDWCGGGGGGAGSAGGIPTTSGSTQAGNGGNGFAVAVESLSPTYYGGGGGGGSYNPTLDSTGGLGGGGAGGKNVPGANGTYALGGGGGGGGFSGGTSYRGGNGGTGLIALRWITASVPTYTKPTNAYLNVGMTETFTTNVAVDSATVALTRTFTWESSTTGAGGPFSPIKTGTGAANAAFSWVPSDTSTSGSNFLYRLTVTDSDTAGLFITDSSTAFAVINKTLLMSGATSIKKTINVTRNENYTISQGTPTYAYTLTPTISGITLDTTTVGTAILKIADTATVGTYLETLTVIDSVTGTVVIPVTIVISAPPTLSNGGEVVSSGQVFSIDSGNSASYTPGTAASGNSAIRDISGGKKTVSINGTLSYSDDFSGVLTLNTANSNYLNFTKDSRLTAWTLEAYIRLDSALTAGSCVISNQYSGTNLNYALCLDSSRTFYTGFVINGAWTYKRSSTVLPVGSWFHLVGTFDPTGGIQLYLDGATPVISESYNNAGLSTPLTGLDNVYIGRYLDVNYPTYLMPMTIGAVRIYNRALTSAEVNQNMNATKVRFQTAKVNKVKSTQKYGSLNIDSFTVSAGGETETVTFQTGNRTGITWDTSTVGVVNLSVLSSLPVGTYYDTITVTDNLNSSTYLPIKFTVTKADTITVTTTLSGGSVTYNELPANVTVTQTVTGLVNSETATVTNSFTGFSCEAGGACAVGDTDPGGGKVFYVSATPFTCGISLASSCRYLSVAPSTWFNTSSDPLLIWDPTSPSTVNVSGIADEARFQLSASGVGLGLYNSSLIVNQVSSNAATTAAAAARAYAGGGLTDWYLPTFSELNLLCQWNRGVSQSVSTACTGGTVNSGTGAGAGIQTGPYWSSSEVDFPYVGVLHINYSNGSPAQGISTRGGSYAVRPIRAFSQTATASATAPTDAGVYKVGSTFSLTSPATLSNYQGIESVTATLTINKARQKTISIGQYDAYPGISSYPLNVYGGSGPGTLTRTLVSAGTAGCSLASSFILTATSVGSCTVRAEKAGTRNYIVESTTATIYWITLATNYATQTLGGNHAIPLNGGNQIVVRTETLTASAFSNTSGGAITSAAVGTTIRINSTGFAGLTPSSLSVTFRPYEDAVITAVTSSYVEVVIPSGAVTGVIAIDSPRGVAYTSSFTISP